VIVLPKGPRVLVAQRSLQPGTIITNDAVNFQEWPRNMVNGAYFVDGKTDMNKLLGTVVRFPITAGQPLTRRRWWHRATAASLPPRWGRACAR
jgi:pilus assembly protein CpaB